MSAKPHPGYVYVLENPATPGWVKVGRTGRPPHRRARELSGTAVRQDFRVAHARFFWDAVHAERAIHQQLVQNLGPSHRNKEFFEMEALAAMDVVSALPDPIWQEATGLESDWNPAFHDRDMLENRWTWAEEKAADADPKVRIEGWREMEQLSAEGWQDASVRLAERLMGRFDDIESLHDAGWVWHAAQTQGAEGAGAWAAWCQTLPDGNGLSALLDGVMNRWGTDSELLWPPLLGSLFEREIDLWRVRPDRAISHPWWSRLARAWDAEEALMGKDWNPERRQAWERLHRQPAAGSEQVSSPAPAKSPKGP
jgi:hypothetical protein